MKFALLSVSYSGLFYAGSPLSIEQQIYKAKELGFDGLAIETKRPVAFPLDLTQGRPRADQVCRRRSGRRAVRRRKHVELHEPLHGRAREQSRDDAERARARRRSRRRHGQGLRRLARTRERRRGARDVRAVRARQPLQAAVSARPSQVAAGRGRHSRGRRLGGRHGHHARPSESRTGHRARVRGRARDGAGDRSEERQAVSRCAALLRAPGFGAS